MTTASSVTLSTVKTKRLRTKKSKENLLNIAAKMFREKGYNATSIRDIVKKEKIEPSALYYYFASKEALLDAVLDRSILNVMNEVRDSVSKMPSSSSFRVLIQEAISAHLCSIIIHGDFALASRRVIGEIPPAIRRRHDAMRAEYGAYWESLFQRAAEANEIRPNARIGLARMFLMGALNWSSEWFDPKKKSPEKMAELFCNILFEGLGVEPEPSASKPGKGRPRAVKKVAA